MVTLVIVVSATALLTSCSVPLPAYVRLEPDGSLSVAGCDAIHGITEASLALVSPVAGEPQAFQEHLLSFSGDAFDVAAEEAITFPFVSAGWTSDFDYWEFADWHDASIIVTGLDGGTRAYSFSRADLVVGEWTEVNESDLEGCMPE